MNWEQHFRAMQKPRFDFGAEEKGKTAPGMPAGHAVIPPGRYWLDVYGDKIPAFLAWAQSKPEVHLETTQNDTESTPEHLFVIFSVPPTASNFGLSGVDFSTATFGFPEVAPATVQSSDDVVQKPPPPTASDVLADAASAIGGALGSGGKAAASALDTATLIKFGIVAAVVIVAAPHVLKLLVKPV